MCIGPGCCGGEAKYDRTLSSQCGPHIRVPSVSPWLWTSPTPRSTVAVATRLEAGGDDGGLAVVGTAGDRW